MRALYRAGRQSQALTTYGDLREQADLGGQLEDAQICSVRNEVLDRNGQVDQVGGAEGWLARSDRHGVHATQAWRGRRFGAISQLREDLERSLRRLEEIKLRLSGNLSKLGVGFLGREVQQSGLEDVRLRS